MNLKILIKQELNFDEDLSKSPKKYQKFKTSKFKKKKIVSENSWNISPINLPLQVHLHHHQHQLNSDSNDAIDEDTISRWWWAFTRRITVNKMLSPWHHLSILIEEIHLITPLSESWPIAVQRGKLIKKRCKNIKLPEKNW